MDFSDAALPFGEGLGRSPKYRTGCAKRVAAPVAKGSGQEGVSVGDDGD